MNYGFMIVLAAIGGIMVVLQGGINAKLGVMLGNPLLATLTNLSLSAVLTLLFVAVAVKEYPSIEQVKTIPAYLWVTGAFCSFLAVSIFYMLIPKIGISTAVIFSLTGQIVFSTLAAHYGWLGLPVEPISLQKVIGFIALIAGIILIKI